MNLNESERKVPALFASFTGIGRLQSSHGTLRMAIEETAPTDMDLSAEPAGNGGRPRKQGSPGFRLHFWQNSQRYNNTRLTPNLLEIRS
jgi:hypothetical protein